jgi:hypothetical protein
MKKIIEKLKNYWNADDKKKHVIAGMTVAAAMVILFPAWGWLWAILLTVALAAGKEWSWDASGRGEVDIDDFLATLLGCAVILSFVIIKTITRLIW